MNELKSKHGYCETKFRAYFKPQNKMFYDVYPEYQFWGNGEVRTRWFSPNFDEGRGKETESPQKFGHDWNMYYADGDSIIMESIGLHDKEGHLIYEGDIVEFKRGSQLHYGVIVWNNAQSWFEIRFKTLWGDIASIRPNVANHVIGNVFQHLEGEFDKEVLNLILHVPEWRSSYEGRIIG